MIQLYYNRKKKKWEVLFDGQKVYAASSQKKCYEFIKQATAIALAERNKKL